MLGFRLTPDREADKEHMILPRQGNMRIEALFKKTLPEPVTCIFNAEFPGHSLYDELGHRTLRFNKNNSDPDY